MNLVAAAVPLVITLAATAGRPAPPPPLLAFTTEAAVLAVASVDGSDPVALTTRSQGTAWSPSWSPDGRLIAFARCRRTLECATFVVEADGANERRLSSSGHRVVWMPDGRHLLVDQADDRPGYWVVALRSRARRAFERRELDDAPGAAVLSPNGRWLLHITRAYGRPAPSRYGPHHYRARNWLMITDLAGGRSERVSNVRGWYLVGSAPWSADGTMLTFTRRRFLQAGRGGVFVSSVRDRSPRRVADGARAGASWSPDGRSLVFNGERCGIRIASVDGSETPRTLPYRGCDPVWQPDRR